MSSASTAASFIIRLFSLLGTKHKQLENPTGFSKLPPEIIFIIVDHCDALYEITALANTCHGLRSLLSSRVVHRHIHATMDERVDFMFKMWWAEGRAKSKSSSGTWWEWLAASTNEALPVPNPHGTTCTMSCLRCVFRQS